MRRAWLTWPLCWLLWFPRFQWFRFGRSPKSHQWSSRRSFAERAPNLWLCAASARDAALSQPAPKNEVFGANTYRKRSTGAQSQQLQRRRSSGPGTCGIPYASLGSRPPASDARRRHPDVIQKRYAATARAEMVRPVPPPPDPRRRPVFGTRGRGPPSGSRPAPAPSDDWPTLFRKRRAGRRYASR